MIVVLGNGILGSEISHQTGWLNISRQLEGFDICREESYKIIPESCTVIVNCIANTGTWSDDRDGHWETNYAGVHKLIQYCNSQRIKLVHISTDYVYAGTVNANNMSGASEEDVPVNACNWYSYTKLLGDGLVQLLSNDYLICRCSHKPIPFPHKIAYSNKYGSFDYVDKIADLVIGLISVGASGVYNVGTHPKTVYELAKQTRTDVQSAPAPKDMPAYSIMNVNKLKKTLIGMT